MSREFHPRVDNDRRLNPILSLVDEMHVLAVSGNPHAKEVQLRRLGRGLIPHVQTVDQSINIGEFIRVGDSAIVTKGQFWDWEVAMEDRKYHIRRTDVWNGAGVNLSIEASKVKYMDMRICMQKQSGIYYIGMTLDSDITKWQPDLAFERPSWRPGKWKKIEE